MSKVLPTKSLFDPNKAQQHQYVHSSNTNIAVTWAKWRKAHEVATTDHNYQRDVLAEARARKVRK